MGTPSSKTRKFKHSLEEKLISIYPPADTGVIKATSKKPTKSIPQNIQRVALNAKPVEESNHVIVNAFDGRTQVFATGEWPNSVHGLVSMKFKNDNCWGTGIMIGPNVVLTAGHNLYSHQRKAYADLGSLQFLPGMSGQMLPFGLIGVGEYFVSPQYVKEEKEDYGILILKEPVGEITGYFGLACLEVGEFRERNINITGYPGDKVASKPNIYEMWGMGGNASHIDKEKGLINYLIDTGAGQSGSGVWFQEGEDFYVCGVHVSGTQFVNTATLLTKARYQQIKIWLRQASFKSSILQLGESKKLRLNFQEIDAECVSLLMNYNLDGLTILKLSGNKIGDEGIKILAKNTSWVNLSQLDLKENNISVEGAKALVQNASWNNLSKPDLSFNAIGSDGAKAIAENTVWTNLSKLGLSGNNIKTKGVIALVQNTYWVNLSQLSLGRNDIDAAGARFLARNAFWTNLSQLDLNVNAIGAEGAEALAQNTSWINLSKLNLKCNMIGARGAQELAQNASWVKLSWFDLSWNDLGTKGAKGLAQNTSWVNLSYLNLESNNIGAEGYEALKQNKVWKR